MYRFGETLRLFDDVVGKARNERGVDDMEAAAVGGPSIGVDGDRCNL